MERARLFEVDVWLNSNRANLEARGIVVTVADSAADRIPASKVLDFDDGERSARLVVWSDGQAQLNAGNHALGLVELDEYVADINSAGLAATLRRLLVIFE